MRTLELAPSLQLHGHSLKILQRKLSVDDLLHAKELMLVGTTLGVLPVSAFEDRRWHQFECAALLFKTLQEDLAQGVARKVSAAL